MPPLIAIPLILMFVASFYFSCVFLYRVVGSVFSPNLRKAIAEKPFRYFLMFFAIPIFIGLILLWNPWPLKLHKERVLAMERIQEAGGLGAISRGCQLLVRQYTNYEEYIWVRGRVTNSVPLPPEITALKPYAVKYYPYDVTPIIQIHLLGMHSTDGPWPEYWLWFICRPMSEDYRPKVDNQSHWFPITVRKLTNSLFEVTD